MFPLRCEISLEVSVFCGLEVLEERLNSLERSDANLVQVLVPVVVQLKNELLDERVQLIFVFELFDNFFDFLLGWRGGDARKNLALVLLFLFLLRLDFCRWLSRRL